MMKNIKTQQDAARALVGMMQDIKKKAAIAQAISNKFWTRDSPIGRCPSRIEAYAKEMQDYMSKLGGTPS